VLETNEDVQRGIERKKKDFVAMLETNEDVQRGTERLKIDVEKFATSFDLASSS
jgi:hypothetical protein